MAGIIVPILEKRMFDFSYLGSSPAYQEVVIQPHVDVGAWYRVRIVVRVHGITATSGNFTFKLQHALPSSDDSQEFIDATSDFLTTSAITDASPNIKTASATDPQAYLKILLRASQGTAGDALYGEFSAALILRDT